MAKGQWGQFLKHSNDSTDHRDVSIRYNDSILTKCNSIDNSDNIIVQNDGRVRNCESK